MASLDPQVVQTQNGFCAADGTGLPMAVLEPADRSPYAAVLLFHGGGFVKGEHDRFVPQCRYLADRGLLAAAAGYRLLGRGATRLEDCVADVTAAVARFRELTAERGLDPASTVVGGGSAGGFLAARVAAADPARIGAMVLYGPVLDLAPEAAGDPERAARLLALDPGALDQPSPIAAVRPGMPPTLVFHGAADDLVPVAQSRRFRDAMAAAGNTCTVVECAGAGHGFYHEGPDATRWSEQVMAVTADYLRTLFSSGSAKL